MTLKEDKEEQSKYYYNFLQLPALHMKGENRDINVVEWANIPKFSVLDDLVTLLRLFKLFFVTY